MGGNDMTGKRKRIFKGKAARAVLALLIVLSMLFADVLPFMDVAESYAAGSQEGLFAGKYGKDQIFDCVRVPMYPVGGTPLTLGFFGDIYDANEGTLVDWGPGGDRYVQFDDTAVQDDPDAYPDAYNVKLNLYEADGTFVKTISDWGTVWALNELGFLYIGLDYYGYYIANNDACECGESTTYIPDEGLVVDVADLNSYPASAYVIRNGSPGAPTGVSAVPGNGQAVVSFTAPADTGTSPITGYVVTAYPGGITASGASGPVTVEGLTNGTAYTFTVKAVNAAGPGSESLALGPVTPMADPTISVSSDASPAAVGNEMTLTAVLSGADSPTGTVVFKNDGTALGSAAVSSGTAEFLYTPTALGSLSITAEYAGDSKNTGAASGVLSIEVGKNTPALSVPAAVPASPQTYPVSKITVTAALSSYFGTLGGQTVRFYNGEVLLGTAATDSSGTASLELANMVAGTYSLTAEVSSDGFNNSVSSAAAAFEISKGTQTELTVGGVPATVVYGDSGFKLIPAGGSGTGTAYSFVSDNADVLTVDSLGNVTVKGAGTAKITVTKAGDSNYNPVSREVSITVAPKPLAVSVSPVTITSGQAIPALVVNVTGFVGSDTESNIAGFQKPLAGQNYGSTAAPVTSAVLAVTYSGGNAAKNYTFSYTTTTTITINPVTAILVKSTVNANSSTSPNTRDSAPVAGYLMLQAAVVIMAAVTLKKRRPIGNDMK